MNFIANELHLEMKFESESMAYEFYNECSKRNEFGIRLEYSNKSKVDGILTSKRFTCFKKGIQGVVKRRHSTVKPRVETKIGCQVRMFILLDRKMRNIRLSILWINITTIFNL